MMVLGIAIAGALGAVARYGVSLWALRQFGSGFPIGTLLVNLAGCFGLGFLAEVTLEDPTMSANVRAIVGTGFFGAFTTFSTFGVETFRAMEAGEWGVALTNLLVNVLLGLCLVAAGFWAARQIGGG
ncbi:MAG: fluoride efflux transporter CrcB [Acidobacteria bacterium]|nr:fluoride efflux transporter CrcB [Acidobacteriota bacterium]